MPGGSRGHPRRLIAHTDGTVPGLLIRGARVRVPLWAPVHSACSLVRQKRRPRMAETAGSNPAAQTIFSSGCSLVAKAPDLGSGDRRFESCHPHHLPRSLNGRALGLHPRYVGSTPTRGTTISRAPSTVDSASVRHAGEEGSIPSVPTIGTQVAGRSIGSFGVVRLHGHVGSSPTSRPVIAPFA